MECPARQDDRGQHRNINLVDLELFAMEDPLRSELLGKCCEMIRTMIAAKHVVIFELTDGRFVAVARSNEAPAAIGDSFAPVPAHVNDDSQDSRSQHATFPIHDATGEVLAEAPATFVQETEFCKAIGLPILKSDGTAGLFAILCSRNTGFLPPHFVSLKTMANIVSRYDARAARTQIGLHISEAIGTLLYTVDHTLRLSLASNTFCKLLGYTQSDLIGMKLKQLICEDSDEMEFLLTRHQAIKHRDHRFKLRYRKSDGAAITLLCRSSAITNSKAEPCGFRIEQIHSPRVFVDRVDNQVYAATRELATARTADLEVSRMKHAFIANVNHELRTPLSVILGSSKLLLQSNLSEVQRTFSEMLHESATDLLQIVNDLLDVASMDAGRASTETVPFNLKCLIDNVNRGISTTGEHGELSFLTVVDSNVPQSLRGDPGRLRQVLRKLIENGFKFTNTGGVRLSVMVVARQERSVKIRFEVADTGIGMSREEQDRLLEQTPLTQLDDGCNRMYNGMGLGLTLSRQLLELMGSHLEFVSEKGKGSVFRFEVVFDGTQAGPTSHSIRKEQQILVVEDSPLVQKLLLLQLSNLGFQAIAVSDGQQAVEAAIDGRFDLILMDCMMPLMDGFEATKRIRSHEATKGTHTPIIAVTAMGADSEKFLEAGMDDHLSKPVDEAQLKKKIEEWLAVSPPAKV